MTNGLVTLRAYRRFPYYKTEFLEAVEKSANTELNSRVCNRWVGSRLDMTAAFFGCSTVFFVIAFKGIIERSSLTFCL